MEELTHTSIQDEAPVEDFGRASIVRSIYRKPIVFDEVCYEGNLASRWGRLSGSEMLHRIWQGLIAGTYVTHGECYQWNAGSMDTIFWAKEENGAVNRGNVFLLPAVCWIRCRIRCNWRMSVVTIGRLRLARVII